jgi:hypothetical protein
MQFGLAYEREGLKTVFMGEATIRYEDFNGVGLGNNRPIADITPALF